MDDPITALFWILFAGLLILADIAIWFGGDLQCTIC